MFKHIKKSAGNTYMITLFVRCLWMSKYCQQFLLRSVKLPCEIINLSIPHGILIILQYYLGCRIIKANCGIIVFFDFNYPALEKDELVAERTDSIYFCALLHEYKMLFTKKLVEGTGQRRFININEFY